MLPRACRQEPNLEVTNVLRAFLEPMKVQWISGRPVQFAASSCIHWRVESVPNPTVFLPPWEGEIFPTKGNFKQKYITTRICSQDRLKSKFIQHLTHSFCIDCCCLTWRFEPGDREKMPESPRCLGFYILCPKKTGGVTGWLRSGKN